MSIRNEITFSTILSKDFEFIRNIEVFLEVNFPLVFSFNANENKKYLAYVLDFKRRKKILNIMFVETDNNTLHNLLDQKISLRTALTKSSPYILYLDENEVYKNPNEVLPNENFLLTELLPNNVDILLKKHRIEYEMRLERSYYDELIKFKEIKGSYSQLLKFTSSIDKEHLKTVVKQQTLNYKNSNKNSFWSNPRQENKSIVEEYVASHVKVLKRSMSDDYVLSDNFTDK